MFSSKRLRREFANSQVNSESKQRARQVQVTISKVNIWEPHETWVLPETWSRATTDVQDPLKAASVTLQPRM